MEIQTTPLGYSVIGCAIEAHAALGPGLLESVYERSAAHEFLGVRQGFLFNFNVRRLTDGLKSMLL